MFLFFFTFLFLHLSQIRQQTKTNIEKKSNYYLKKIQDKFQHNPFWYLKGGTFVSKMGMETGRPIV